MTSVIVFAPRMSETDRHARLGKAGLCAATAAIGFYDGVFGPGTGSFFTTLLVALAGLGLIRAIAHTKFLNFTTNLAGLSVMIVGGQVIWTLGLAMALASVAGGQAGAHAAMRFGGKGVRALLVVMSLALTARLLSDPDNPLRQAALGWWGL